MHSEQYIICIRLILSVWLTDWLTDYCVCVCVCVWGGGCLCVCVCVCVGGWLRSWDWEWEVLSRVRKSHQGPSVTDSLLNHRGGQPGSCLLFKLCESVPAFIPPTRGAAPQRGRGVFQFESMNSHRSLEIGFSIYARHLSLALETEGSGQIRKGVGAVALGLWWVPVWSLAAFAVTVFLGGSVIFSPLLRTSLSPQGFLHYREVRKEAHLDLWPRWFMNMMAQDSTMEHGAQWKTCRTMQNEYSILPTDHLKDR